MDIKKLDNISFTAENIEEFIKNCKNQTKLLPLYLDKIRNGICFTDDMLEIIDNFDNSSKMKIIIEYNQYMKFIKEVILNS
jgi:hypothetical protein